MRTLMERLESAVSAERGVTFISGDDAERVSWAQIHVEAQGYAGALQARGAAPGVHVALLGPTTRQLVTAIRAIWLTGATLVVLPLPMRLGSLEEFVRQTRERILQADISLLIVDPDLAPFIEPQPGDPPSILLDQLASLGRPAQFRSITAADDDLGVLQFTSGSTANPKGVMLPQHTISANLDAIMEAASLEVDTDVMVSWLPLYHDMGLVGFCMLPMTTGTEMVIGAPQDFMARPARWMEWMSSFGGSVTAGPNFSWVLAARSLRRGGDYDLGRLRVALNGAEPIDAASVRSLTDAGEQYGMSPGAIFPAFGMAEVVIGGAFPVPGTGLQTDPVSRHALESERLAAPADPSHPGTRELALLGRPLPGLEFRIVDPDTNSTMNEREVGELEIRGSSVTTGYYKRPEVTAEAFHDDWFKTGDLAYLVDGQLVVAGRIKDVIIVGGRNVYPEEIEKAVGSCEGVRTGNVIAFGIPGKHGKEELVIVAESRDSDPAEVRSSVASQVRSAVGLPAKDIVLVEPGTVPKTSSGKLQRSRCRDQYLSEDRSGRS